MLHPRFVDYLDSESREEFDQLLAYLEALDIPYRVNPRLVRGLDYYNKSVFEWTTNALGAQGTVCGGGRYDSLVEIFGGKPMPAAGFAVGLERLILLMQALEITVSSPADLYVIAADERDISAYFAADRCVAQAIPGSEYCSASGRWQLQEPVQARRQERRFLGIGLWRNRSYQ